MKSILVLGLGNLVLKDEGIGIHVIDHLQKMDLPNEVDLLDGGTGGIFLIGTLQEYKHLIIIDATLDQEIPGTVKRIKPRYSQDYPKLLSAHEIGLKDMIDAMIIQEDIPEVDLITVTAKEIQEIGLLLSPDVTSAIPKVIALIKEIISEIQTSEK